MTQLPRIQVYVSYSRDEEARNNTISEMQNKLQDIEFKIDTEQVNYRDDFMSFIKTIGKADFVVVVFSQAYLKSFYCMYELTKIMQAGNINQRVFPIRDDNYPLNVETNQKTIIDYWKQVAEAGEGSRPKGLTQFGSLAEIKEIQSQLENIFKQFQTIHAPTAEELAPTFKALFDDAYQAIREWLRNCQPEAVLKGKKQLSDKKFIFKVEKEITQILKRFPVLYQCIKAEFENVVDEDRLAKILCDYEDQSDLLADILIGACKESVQSFSQKVSKTKVLELKSNIRKLLSCLCVMAINPEWVKKQMDYKGKVILIPVETSLAEVSTAGRLGQVIPEISAEQENKVRGKYEISPFKAESWDNKNNLVIDAILRFIYNTVFEVPQLKGDANINGKITEGERKQLNTQIKLNASDGTRHYYCMLREKETASQFLNDPKLIVQVKQKLPALDIFELQDSLGNIVLVAGDEHILSQTYHHFLTQLEKW